MFAALVYACDQQASDSAGVTVGSSIDVARHEAGSPDADSPAAAEGSGALDDDDVAGELSADPGLVVAPDPAGGPGAVVSPGGDGSTPTTGPAAPPTTEPPTAVDLLVDEITVPSTSEPTVDGCGDPLSFGARSMIDGEDDTTWRMDGDGTGITLVLELEGPRRVLSVGLTPGFDAVDACNGTDRFATNRRITHATWEFDDGSRFEQRFIDVASLQRIDVNALTTRIEVHIDGVSADPEADFTAVSELVVRGV